MINLRNSPFLWLALLLLGAYALMDLIQLQLWPYSIAALSSGCLLCSMAAFLKYKPGTRLVSTLVLSICVITAASIRWIAFENENFPGYPLVQGIRLDIDAHVIKVLKANQKATTLRCRVTDQQYNEKSATALFTDQYLLVRIKGNQHKDFFPGDQLTMSGWVFPIKGPQNPHAFDLRKYYRTLGIRHQITCVDSLVSRHTRHQRSVMRLSAKWQSVLCKIVKANTSTEVGQMTNALVFGERSSMNQEIRNAFADSGAMHVLSVSGMHMAIIYSMLYLLLGPPGSGTLLRRMLRLSMYILSILIYVGLTGASPAVLRAGVMIILFILGKAMGWNTQIWNLLGFAAFAMLWQDPFIWHNIGFQLSFLAMAGILLFAKPIIRLFSFKKILFQRIWEITAVSISAQTFIIPIILHHFYQLPLTFILSSLVAMPASYIIIFGALLNILLSPFHLEWLWQCFDQIGQLFMHIMKWMAALNPHMNFSLPFYSAVLMFAASVVFSCGLVYNWVSGKKIAFALAAMSILSLGWHRTTQWTTNDLTVYHNYSGLVLDLMINGQCITLQDSALSSSNVEFSTRGNRVHRDIIHSTQLSENEMYTRAQWHFSRSGFHSSTLSFTLWNGEEVPDDPNTLSSFLLINKCPDLSNLKNYLIENKNYFTILPAHLDRRIKKEISHILDELAIPFWDIEKQGYFRLRL